MFKKILKYLLLIVLFLVQLPSWACLACNRPLRVSVFDDNFWKNSFYLVLPLLVIGAIISRIYKLK